MVWPQVAMAAGSMAMNAIGNSREERKQEKQHQEQMQQMQQMQMQQMQTQPVGNPNMQAQQMMGTQVNNPFNVKRTGLGWDLAAGVSGAIAGGIYAKKHDDMNMFEGIARGGIGAFAQKNAYDNIQKEGGAVRVAAYSGISGMALSGFSEEGGKDWKSAVSVGLKNAGVMSVTDLTHDQLTKHGHAGMADIAAGLGTAGSVVGSVNNFDKDELFGKNDGQTQPSNLLSKVMNSPAAMPAADSSQPQVAELVAAQQQGSQAALPSPSQNMELA